MNLNSPVTARLNPDQPDMPDDLALLRTDIRRGMPQQLDIAPVGLRVVLGISTGLIRPLLKMAPETLVLASKEQRSAHAPPGPAQEELSVALGETRERAAPRLLFIANARYSAQCPLITGTSVFVPMPEQPNSAGLRIWITSFALTVSALIGRNATGSWIEFGWRDISLGSDDFDSAVSRPSLRRNLSYRRNRHGNSETIRIDADLMSPDATKTATAGGLNWRLMHDRL